MPSKPSQELWNCVTSSLNFANTILGRIDFDGCGAGTVKLGCVECGADNEEGGIEVLLVEFAS